MQTCIKCGQCKPFVDFYTQAKNRTGFKKVCKLCENALAAARRRALSPEQKEAEAQRMLLAKVKRQYGLSPQEFAAMTSRGKCDICEKPLVPHRTGKSPMDSGRIDHCHATGKVRGLLCHGCNTSLGHMRDNPETLRRAAAYLEEHHDH